MRVWLDDERPLVEGFDIQVRTVSEAIDVLKTQRVRFISLDHDLGPADAGTGNDVAKWIEQMAFYGAIKRIGWAIHSANPVGRKNMLSAMENAERYWRREEDSRA